MVISLIISLWLHIVTRLQSVFHWDDATDSSIPHDTQANFPLDHLQHIMTKTKQLQIFFRFIYIRELITEFRCEARNIIASNVVDYCLADAINGICVYTCAKCVFVCVCWRPKMFWRTESHSIAHKHKYARIDTRPPRYFQLVLTNCISLTHIHMCAGAHSHIRSVVFVER